MNYRKRLLNGNVVYRRNIYFSGLKLDKVKELANGQHPFGMVITCSDSRVIPENIFACEMGNIFTIRTAGNVINEGELASIEYGIEHLHIEYILVLGHTHCGAIHAAIHDEKGMYLAPILDNIKNCIGEECDERQASIKNALKQVEFLKSKFPEFQGEIKAALYDLETAEVIF